MREWDVGDKRGMRGRGMREAHLSAVSAAVMVLGCSGAAYAADLGNMVTKAPPAPPGPATGRYPTCSRSWVLQQHSFSGRDDQGAQES